MDELVRELGFRVMPAGDAWQIQYVDPKTLKTTHVTPCGYPAIWTLWQIALESFPKEKE